MLLSCTVSGIFNVELWRVIFGLTGNLSLVIENAAIQ